MINIVNSAVLKSIENTLNINGKYCDSKESSSPQPQAFLVHCSLKGEKQNCHFLISFPKQLIEQLMDQFVELHHAGVDHTLLMESIASEIGNLASCELATHPQFIKDLGKVTVSVPSVSQWDDGQIPLPIPMESNSQLLLESEPVHTFVQIQPQK